MSVDVILNNVGRREHAGSGSSCRKCTAFVFTIAGVAIVVLATAVLTPTIFVRIVVVACNILPFVVVNAIVIGTTIRAICIIILIAAVVMIEHDNPTSYRSSEGSFDACPLGRLLCTLLG